jgi:hypothetical protein
MGLVNCDRWPVQPWAISHKSASHRFVDPPGSQRPPSEAGGFSGR